MQIEDMQRRAVEVRDRFADFEVATYGQEWSTEDLVMGLVTDIGDLAAAVQRVEGKRPSRGTKPMDDLRHELSDCLWVLLVLAERYSIDVAAGFESTMQGLDAWLDKSAS